MDITKYPYPLLNSTQASMILGIKPQTLRQWRHNSTYLIPYIKKGGKCYYYLEDLMKFQKNPTLYRPGPKPEILRLA